MPCADNVDFAIGSNRTEKIISMSNAIENCRQPNSEQWRSARRLAAFPTWPKHSGRRA